ncbi:hypothetical protein AWC38_SpisGene14196 [Stylophora pistillata]|uniref:Peptidase aspartic putative domain-containing protein n=1 Tax=Stylophora pistillata TaxID=50429 RepID=A0A2B4RYB2_STYPI|nr:hypothetical protein AWC38_SpisGene14196 [Stylophora pistillata]
MTHSCTLLPILKTELPPELSEKWGVELIDIKEESVDLQLFFKLINKKVISKEAGERNASMTGENGEKARGSGGRDKDGAGSTNNIKWICSFIQIQDATDLITDRDSVQRGPARVLFDSGNLRSYITKKVAESLALDGPSEVLSVSMLGGETNPTKRMKRVSFTPVQESISKPVRMEALTIDKICTPLEPVEISFQYYPHLQSFILADSYPCGPVNVDILIGADFYFSFRSGKCKKGETTRAPTAIESTQGWIVGGSIEGLPCKNTHHSMLSMVRIDPVTDSLLQFWELESIGIVNKGDAPMSLGGEKSVRQFNKELKFDGNPERANALEDAINKYVEKEFAAEVKEAVDGNEKVRYLPHHGVFEEDKKTTKCLVVFDAATYDEDEVSLNDCILLGPAPQPNLVSVLLRSRARRIALIADVEKMFLQINVDERDQDALQYLWSDVNSDGTTDNIQAAELQQSLDRMMERGGFNLTKWASNSKEVLSHIAEQEQAESNTIDFNANDVKAYVTTKSDFGIATGNKLTPKEVAEDMRFARNEEGERIFLREEWLKESQIESFFSRLASTRKYSTPSEKEEAAGVEWKNLKMSMALKSEDGEDYSASIQILGAAESSLRINDLNSCRLAPGKKSLESIHLRTISISINKVSTRGKWPMGRVDRLLPGKDGTSSTVTLKTEKRLLRRPVQRPHRLEGSSTQFLNGESGDSGAYGGESATRKVMKKAKKKAKNKLRRNQCQVSNSFEEVGKMFWPGPAVVEHHDPL